MSRDDDTSSRAADTQSDACEPIKCCGGSHNTNGTNGTNMNDNNNNTVSSNTSGTSTSTSTSSSGSSNRFADLPGDVLEQVFQALADTSFRDLCSVSLVNKHWHDIADSILYKDVRFETPEHHVVFGKSLARRERRGSAIHYASVAYTPSQLEHFADWGRIIDPAVGTQYMPEHYEGLAHTISTMSNLQELEICLPDDMLHGIGALFNGPFDLACLKSCSLFYKSRADQYWDLRENIHIFAHPTLEVLYIRRARLDYRGFDFIERPHELPLKKLHLIECDISDDALGDVLELPRALDEFVMTQSAEPRPPLEESSDNLGDYIVALQSQCESLEHITIDFPSMGSRRPLRMRDFVSLKTFRINWDWQLFGKMHNKPRLHSFGVPPFLEKLEFFNELGTDEEATELLEYLMKTSDVAAKAIQTTLIKSINDSLVTCEHLVSRNRRDSFILTLT